MQVYSKVSGEPQLDAPTIDISSKEFYGEGYDDSDKRIPDMTIINRQLGREVLFYQNSFMLEICPSPNLLSVFLRLEPEDISLGLARVDSYLPTPDIRRSCKEGHCKAGGELRSMKLSCAASFVSCVRVMILWFLL